jgi:peptide/nickel transport system substrate-binding protein
MKRLFFPLAILMVVAILIAGCSSATTSTTPTTPTTSTPSGSTPATSTPPKTTPTSTAPPSSTTPAGTQTYGGTVRFIQQNGPGAPFGAPWLANGTSTIDTQYSAQMLLNGQADASLTPSLATSWDIVNDPAKPSITLHLRQGVKFQDGTDFNAQAVKWNFDMMKSPGSTTAGTTVNWASVDILDNYTIRINLKTWQNTALGAFGTAACYMVSPTAYQTNSAEWMNTHVVGTGPFVQTSYQSDVSLSLKKNTNYWEPGKPYLDNFTNLFVSDPLTAEALFKSGGGEMLQSYSDQMTNDFRNVSGYTLIPSQIGGAVSIWPDSANPDSPWSNLLVREAAEYAIDKASLAKTFGYGNWTPAAQNQSQVSPAYDPNLVPRNYDPAKAKQLLTQAGYPQGFKTNLVVSPFGVSQNIAVALQAMFGAVGIKIDMQFPQAGAFAAMLTGGSWSGIMVGAGAGQANPLTSWNLTLSPTTTWFASMKRPAGINDLFTAALSTPELDPAACKKVEDALFNDCTIITLWFSNNYFIVTDKFHGGGIGTRDLFAWFQPQDIWLSK